ncbi:MAG: oxidoreductase [Sulfobacillus benefaciens]|uniref:Oxidoreductase n=1 Tax=Sulfobacillus benefaciens TaxID=453960 RepID=A0A2T2XI10_9FIRM|nr:MAG: oxidoreductase [Sulfobacillus benefaciens]
MLVTRFEAKLGVSGTVELTQHLSVCPFDCPDTCSLMVLKDRDTIIKVTGNPGHPVTRGAICDKVRHLPMRTYHPERLMRPMRRLGPKGTLRFEPISWDAAYAEISERFRSIIQTHGPEAILPYSFYGNMGILNAEGMDRRFFNRLGSSVLDRTICNSSGAEGFRYTMGVNAGLDPEDTVNSKLIIVWGANIVSTNMHQVLYANEARKRGAQIIHIDVQENRTARWADWYVPVLPGTDAALALGMMHVMVRDNLVNHPFIERYTQGYPELVAHLHQFTPEYVSNITRVPADDIVRLGHIYGSTSPSFIRIGNGLQHHDNGGMIVRAITCLPALTGQWGLVGGGALKGNSWYAGLNTAAVQRPDLRPNRHARTINMNQLGEALLRATPPIQSLFVYNSNPAVVAPNQNKVREGLLREDLFTVVHDLFLTDTCLYADLVLPATSHFENLDIYKSYWHLYLQLQEPIIEPLGECKSNFTLFQELAQWMAFDEACFRETEEDMIRTALDTGNQYIKGITYERLKEEKWVKLMVPSHDQFPHHIPTPSGKIELYSQALSEAGLSGLPDYTPLKEPMTYPLHLISGPNHHFLNSTFANLASLQRKAHVPEIAMHEDDASMRNLKTGDQVILWNDRGHCTMRVRVGREVMSGVVVSQGLWWTEAVNALTSDRLSDLGGGATFFSTRVDVVKAPTD